MRVRAIAIWLLSALVVCAATACGTDQPNVPAGAEPPIPTSPRPARGSSPRSIEAGLGYLTQVARFPGLATDVAGLPNGHELLVTTRAGRVYRIRLETRSGAIVPVPDPHPVLDLTSRTATDGQERGMLGIAIAPDDRAVYVDYTALGGTVTVLGFPYRPGAALDPSRAWTMLSVPHPTPGHNGGALAFTRSGDLLVSIGDGDDVGPGLPSAQDPSTPLGGIVALHVTATGRAAGRPVQLAKGMRNPWRVSVDADTGLLWVGDVGESSVEEIDTVPPTVHGTPPNYGWPVIEGNRPGPRTDLAIAHPVPPVLTRRHGDGVCGIVGGAVYRGLRLPSLYGAFVYGDLCSSELRAFVLRDGKAVDDTRIAVGSSLVISITQGPQGELYVATVDGAVLRLDPSPRPVTTPPTTVPGSSVSSAGKSTPQCRVAPALDALGTEVDDPATPPAKFEATMQQFVRLLESQPATGPAELQQSMKILLRYFRLVAAEAAAHDWNLRDPALQAYAKATQNGHGPVPGFLHAVEVVDAFHLAKCG